LNVKDLEDLEGIATSKETENTDIPDDILKVFKKTYGILNIKNDTELNAILASMEREYKVNSTSNIIHDSAQLNQKQKASDPQKDEEKYNNNNLNSKINEEVKNMSALAPAPVPSPSSTTIVPSLADSTVFKFEVPAPAPSSNIVSDPTTVIINEDMRRGVNNDPAENFAGKNMNQNFKNFFKKYQDHYHIYNPKGDGDCFFYVAQEALLGIGIKTTVNELRQLVSSKVNGDTIALYQSPYLAGPENGSDIANPYEFIDQNNTIESLKKYILTQAYWADEFAISVIEKECLPESHTAQEHTLKEAQQLPLSEELSHKDKV
jgi:hypothetical protein